MIKGTDNSLTQKNEPLADTLGKAERGLQSVRPTLGNCFKDIKRWGTVLRDWIEHI